MKNLKRLLMAAVTVTWSIVGPAVFADFRASCVKIDITPETPQWLHGYGPRKSEGVHDRIYHRIAALDDGRTTLFVVASDICTITPSFYTKVCKELERQTGIRSDQVWWTVTHTHSAPHVGPQDLGQLFSRTLGDRFSMQHDRDHWKVCSRSTDRRHQIGQTTTGTGATRNWCGNGRSQHQPSGGHQ